MKIVFGGMENYVMLVDLRLVSMIGKKVDKLMSGVNIIVNKNIVFFDLEFFFVMSGLWLGFLVMISWGMKVVEFIEIGDIIVEWLLNLEDEVVV